jgi:hypothetical protein
VRREHAKAALKTKTITKNYGTRLGKPQNVKKIFLVERVERQRRPLPIEPVVNSHVKAIAKTREAVAGGSEVRFFKQGLLSNYSSEYCFDDLEISA